MYLLTIDLLWNFILIFSLFYYIVQIVVISILVYFLFSYCNTFLDNLIADFNIQKVLFDSSEGISQIETRVINILQRYNYLLNFIHRCNDYWKKLVGIAVLTSILCVGAILAVTSRFDEEAMSIGIMTIALAMFFNVPFFILGNRNFKKVCSF